MLSIVPEFSCELIFVNNVAVILLYTLNISLDIVLSVPV